ncbi:MAG: hypothetical protein JNK69_09505 [Saprospiraceae bacterium]|nr:hypothetical protein [Saprospiraceae bacterium]HRG34332.1 hypothetical protein [Saprospiraceae bacterium]
MKLVINFLIIWIFNYPLLSQNSLHKDLTRRKYFLEIYLGPTISNQQTNIIEDQVFESNPYVRNTPHYRLLYHCGLDFNRIVNDKLTLGTGLRYQLKGGKYSYAFGLDSFEYRYDVIPHAMLLIKTEFWICKSVSINNGITIGTNVFRPIQPFRIEWAILSGLKFRITDKLSSGIYYNQGINQLKLIPHTGTRKFYSFDLSLNYRIYKIKLWKK